MNELTKDPSILKFSKHYLINGWGISQQDRCRDLKVAYPLRWNLFRDYLSAMGNEGNNKTEHDVVCQLEGEDINYIKTKFKLTSKININLEVNLVNRQNKILKSCTFYLRKSSPPTSEFIQMAYFLALSDCIKKALV